MAKPIPSLKKPSAPLPVSAMAAFVSGEQEATPLLVPRIELATDEGATPPPELVVATTASEPSATVHSIDGGTAPRRPKAAAKNGRRLETRSDGSVTRKVTVYLAPDLDKQLSLHAVTNDVDRSDIVAEALTRYLRKTAS